MPRMGSKVGTPPGTLVPKEVAIGCGDSPIQWCGQFEPLPLSCSGGSVTQKFLCSEGRAGVLWGLWD